MLPPHYYHLALSKIQGIGPIRFKKIQTQFPDLRLLFTTTPKILHKKYGIPYAIAQLIHSCDIAASVHAEIDFCAKHNIQIITQQHPGYPQNLLQCADAPIVLYQKGACNFPTNKKYIAIIGTRHYTNYGRQMCEQLIEGLQNLPVIIVSGLAYGIDIIAHQKAIQSQIPTVGVVAHSLEQIYPSAHNRIALDMLSEGALLSEFCSHTKPDKGNFPARNRIVAGMCDATIVVESAITGGSLITANFAHQYQREVMCFPGRVGDIRSEGCLQLIKDLKASLITSAADVIDLLQIKKSKRAVTHQLSLYTSIPHTWQPIIAYLQQKSPVHLDELKQAIAMQESELAMIMLEMELQGMIISKPGNLIALHA